MRNSAIIATASDSVTAGGAGYQDVISTTGAGIVKDVRVYVLTNTGNIDKFSVEIDGTENEYPNKNSILEITDALFYETSFKVKAYFDSAVTSNFEYRAIIHEEN